jgi:hypothetical protein
MRRNVGSPLTGRVSSNFGGSVNHRTKKIIAGLLIATIGPLVATTLAASVSLNGGTALEFGQGSNAAIACDTTITTAITETWYQTGAYFQVGTIVLTGLNSAVSSSSDGGCGGKVIKISLLGSDGTALAIGTTGTTTSSSVTITSATVATIASANGTTAAISGTTPAHTLTLTVGSAVLNAATVYRVALETSTS